MKGFLKKIQFNSPVVLSFSLLALLALLLGAISSGKTNSLIFSVYHSPLSNPMTWLRFFTHCLGHANYEHFIGNILLILVVGPPMEERYGSKVILVCMLITSFVSGWVVWLIMPNTAVLGASGLVFMFILLSSFGGMKEGRIPLTLILVAVLYLGGEIVEGIIAKDSISQLTHVIGGVCGGAMGFALRHGKKSPPAEPELPRINSVGPGPQVGSDYTGGDNTNG